MDENNIITEELNVADEQTSQRPSGKFGKLIQAAEQTGARYALIYGTNELAHGVVKVRDTQERREIAFPRESLADTLFGILQTGLPVIEEPHCHGDGSCDHCTCGKREAH